MVVQNQTKINKGGILEKYKITPKRKAQMHVPLCKMVPMPWLDMFSNLISWRWSRLFTWDTRKETRFFTYLQQTRKVRRRVLFYTMIHGMNTSSLSLNNLRSYYTKTHTLFAFPTKCFLYWTWITTPMHGCLSLASYIVIPSWNISIDLILLDTSHKLVELLINMTNVNEYVFLLFVCFY